MNFLITCSGGIQAIALLNDLRKIQHAVIFGCDWNASNINQLELDFSFESPAIADENKYIAFLLTICEQNKIDYIIPATSIDLLILSSNKVTFKNTGAFCLVPDLNELKVLLNKETWSSIFSSQLGVNIPKVFASHDEICFPVISKKKETWGSKGICVYKNSESFKEFDWPEDSFISEYIEADAEFSLDFFVHHTGCITGPVVRKRILVSGGFALISFWTEMSRSLQNNWDKLSGFFSRPECCGYYNVQFLVRKDEAFLIDVNPRIGTSATFSSSPYSDGLFHSAIQKKQIYSSFKKGKIIRRINDIALPDIQLNNIHVVIFDLDDTLISNFHFILNRCFLLYQSLFSNTINLDEFINYCKELLMNGKAFELIDKIYEKFQPNLSREAILEKYRTCLPEETTVFHGVESTLQYLYKKNYRLIIYSSSSNQLIKHKISTSILKNFVHEFYSSQDMSIDDKKSFSSIRHFVCNESTKMDNIVMIGDHYFEDIEGAILAGCAAAFYVHQPNGLIPEIEVGDEYIKSGVIKIPKLNYLKNYL